MNDMEVELAAAQAVSQAVDGSASGNYTMTCDARPSLQACAEYTFDTKTDFDNFKSKCSAGYSTGHNCDPGKVKCLHTCGAAGQDKCTNGIKGSSKVLTHTWGRPAEIASKECQAENGVLQ